MTVPAYDENSRGKVQHVRGDSSAKNQPSLSALEFLRTTTIGMVKLQPQELSDNAVAFVAADRRLAK